MDRTPIVVDDQRMYALTKNDANQFFLEVVVGGMAMETLVIPLNEVEVASYAEQGKRFLDSLAVDVCRSTQEFRNRAV